MALFDCETAEQNFGKSEKKCNNGDIDFRWLRKDSTMINYSNRAYQREKVTTDLWKQKILVTILVNKFAGIPEVHIRVIQTPGGYRYEVIDGQQRITSVTDFLEGKFPLPDGMVVDDCDVGGMYADKLQENFPAIYESILNYRVSCKWYEDLSPKQTAHLFIEVLNNVNGMKPQEIRNAIQGFYSDYIRDTARSNPENKKALHDIFTREEVTTKNGKTEKLKYFSKKFRLGRMEGDEWLSEFCYFLDNGVRKGITHDKHKLWVEKIQEDGAKYSVKYTDAKKTNEYLDFGLSILKATPKKDKSKLNPMTSLMLILYAIDLKNRYGQVIPEKYAPAFFDVHKRWSSTTKGLYKSELMADGKNQMNPFKDLFGGKNANAINTIFNVLDKELKPDLSAFGVVEIDQTDFTRQMILDKWEEQGCKCYYTGVELEEDNLAGDHYIPRSLGVLQGGVTEYHNLVITSPHLNGKKGNMSGKEFEAYCLTKSGN
jgi:hypothetical protein